VVLDLQGLPVTAQVQGDEMAQMGRIHLALQLQLERGRATTVGAGLLANLDHQITVVRTGVDQLTAHGEVPVAFGQVIPVALTLIRGEGAGLPHTHELEVQLIGIAESGIGDPEVGLAEVEVTTHQGQHATEHDGINLGAVLGLNHSSGELFRISGHVSPPHHADGAVLHRLCHRGNGVLTHRG